MAEVDFQSNWTSILTPPLEGERYLVTDGEVVVIGTYLREQDKTTNIWIIAGFNETEAKTFKIKAWMTLPKPTLIKSNGRNGRVSHLS